MNKLFISHVSEDQVIADTISTALSRITLKQIDAWFSSDESQAGGISAGSDWYQVVKQKLDECDAVIVILTPRSIDKPWVIFESGYCAGNINCDVIPVCIGINLDEIPAPLTNFQSFQLSDYSSLKKFFAKLINRYQIDFDEEMSKVIVENTLSLILKHVKKHEDQEVSVSEAVQYLKQHFDRRFSNFIVQEGSKELYNVSIIIDFPDYKREKKIEIMTDTTIGDILDNIFFMLDGRVEPFTYLKKWILREKEKDLNLVIHEVAHKVPASALIPPDSKWFAIPLQKPYLE